MNAFEIRQELQTIAAIAGGGCEARLVISSNRASSHNRLPAQVEVKFDTDGEWGPKRGISSECATIPAALASAKKKAHAAGRHLQQQEATRVAVMVINRAVRNGISLDQAALIVSGDEAPAAVILQAAEMLSRLATSAPAASIALGHQARMLQHEANGGTL